MNKTLITTMLTACMTLMTACSSDDSFELDSVTQGNSTSDGATGGNTGTGSSTATGSLTSFTVNIDKTTTEPTSGIAAAYYPEDEDNLENNSFDTQIDINLSNPTAKTENGVTVTVNGGHIIANHGSEKGICYYVTGSTSNGSLTIVGDKKYEVILSGVDITNPRLGSPQPAQQEACLRHTGRRYHQQTDRRQHLDERP